MPQGIDGISNFILKQAEAFILCPLKHVINLSFESGIFPEELKITKIKPLFKKGDKPEPGNYRPVALLSSISKIYEKLYENSMKSHFIRNSIIHPNQFGFQKKLINRECSGICNGKYCKCT